MIRAVRSCSLSAALIASMACGARPAPDPPVRIGVLLAETGAADFIGHDERLVLERLVKGAHGRISLVFRNTGTDPQTALAEFQQLVADSSVSAVIGPSTSGESVLLANAAEYAGVPLLSLAASRKITENDAGVTRRWVFQFAANDELAVRATLAAMRVDGISRVALLHSDDAFGRDGAELVRSIAAQQGVEVAGTKGDADATLIWATMGTDSLVRSARRAHPGRPIWLSHGNTSEAFLLKAGTFAEGARLLAGRVLSDVGLDSARPQDDATLRYRRFWSEMTGGTPSTFGGHAHDAFDALFEVIDDAVQSLSGSARRRAIRDRLESQAPFYGVTGVFQFTPSDHSGLGPEALRLYEIKNGTFVVQ